MAARRTRRKKSSRRTKRRSSKRDWKGQPRRHARASKLGWKRHAKSGWRPKKRKAGRRKTRRDATRDWRGQPVRHGRAARKAWRNVANTGPSWKPRRSRGKSRRKAYGFRQHPQSWMKTSRKKGKRSSGRWWTQTPSGRRPKGRGKRDWFGQPRRHAKASSLGWRRTAKRGWSPKRSKRGGKRRDRSFGRSRHY